MHVHTLVRIDPWPISDDKSEIRAFIPARDELLRLPQTLDHYRRIGVARFFIIDNGSTDGSIEFLRTQPDCHVFVTHDSFKDSLGGVDWQNALLNQFGMEHWCLAVDADEWLVYPGYEQKPLPELAEYLDRSGAQGMFAFLLDMYGRGTGADWCTASDQSLLDACRYFDSNYTWYEPVRVPGLQSSRFPKYNVFGGPRLRLLFPRLRHHYYLLRAIWRVRDSLKFPLPETLKPSPALTKIPFIRWLPGTRYQTKHLTAAPIRLSDVTGALLHFKFLEDFYRRSAKAVERKEYWDNASQYSRYLTKLKDPSSFSFYHSDSRAYTGSNQLVQLGILREENGWNGIRNEG